MRITQEADYALRIAHYLSSENRFVDAKSIAENTNVPERFSLKILRKLLIGELVESQKGVGGGYRFSADPKTVTMRSIIELIDGPFAINRCIEADHECSRTGDNKAQRVFHCIFLKINDMVAQKLDAITLDMVISGKVTTEEILAKI